MSALPPTADIVCQTRHVRKVPQADIVASIDTSSAEPRQLAPFDPVYINRLQEAFHMAGTNVCDLQAIPDAILNGT
jgi:acetaldehyde dehydrogenase (acetylating)